MTESQIVGIVQHKPAQEKRQAQINASELMRQIAPIFGAKPK